MKNPPLRDQPVHFARDPYDGTQCNSQYRRFSLFGAKRYLQNSAKRNSGSSRSRLLLPTSIPISIRRQFDFSYKKEFFQRILGNADRHQSGNPRIGVACETEKREEIRL